MMPRYQSTDRPIDLPLLLLPLLLTVSFQYPSHLERSKCTRRTKKAKGKKERETVEENVENVTASLSLLADPLYA